MLGILTAIIGVVAKGKAAKALAGGAAGVVLTAGEPLINALSGGFVEGGLPAVHDLGVVLGQAVIGGLVGYLTVWLAPANKQA